MNIFLKLNENCDDVIKIFIVIHKVKEEKFEMPCLSIDMLKKPFIHICNSFMVRISEAFIFCLHKK